MERYIRLNLLRWALFELFFLSLGCFLVSLVVQGFDVGALIGAVANFIVFIFFFLYGRPPSITVKEHGISLSLYGFTTELPFEALQVTVTDTSRQIGKGVNRITAYSRIMPLNWGYWVVLAGAVTIFGAITYKDGFSEKVLLGSLIFLVAGCLFFYVLIFLMNRFLSIRIKDAELRIFINSNYLNTLDKFPYRYYKSRFFVYKLGLTSELKKEDLQYLINLFQNKLSEDKVLINHAVLRNLSLS